MRFSCCFLPVPGVYGVIRTRRCAKEVPGFASADRAVPSPPLRYPTYAEATGPLAFADDDMKCLIQTEGTKANYLVHTWRRPPPNGRYVQSVGSNEL